MGFKITRIDLDVTGVARCRCRDLQTRRRTDPERLHHLAALAATEITLKATLAG
ncbi:MAG: hypothetical protein R2708_28785 [Vicinamibacterales bacterium]